MVLTDMMLALHCCISPGHQCLYALISHCHATEAYTPENLTAQFYPKTSRFTKTRLKPSCVWTKKLPKTNEGAELAQNRGQIWTQHAQEPL